MQSLDYFLQVVVTLSGNKSIHLVQFYQIDEICKIKHTLAGVRPVWWTSDGLFENAAVSCCCWLTVNGPLNAFAIILLTSAIAGLYRSSVLSNRISCTSSFGFIQISFNYSYQVKNRKGKLIE